MLLVILLRSGGETCHVMSLISRRWLLTTERSASAVSAWLALSPPFPLLAFQMGKFGLQIKAKLENVSRLNPEDEKSFGLNVKFKCSNCGEESDKYNRLELSDRTAMPGGRGEANLVVKCKLCSRVNSTDVVPGSFAAYSSEDSEKFKTIVQLECRGVEPVDCFLSLGFAVTAESGTVFSDLNLEEGEWVDYDVEAHQSVGLYELATQFVRESK